MGMQSVIKKSPFFQAEKSSECLWDNIYYNDIHLSLVISSEWNTHTQYLYKQSP